MVISSLTPLIPQRILACLSQTDSFPRHKSSHAPTHRDKSQVKQIWFSPSTLPHCFYHPTDPQSKAGRFCLPISHTLHHRNPNKSSWNTSVCPSPWSLHNHELPHVSGPHRSGTATSAWGLKTIRRSPLGDCCNYEAAWSHTCSISSATGGEESGTAQSGSSWGSPLCAGGNPAHVFIWNPTLREPANATDTKKDEFLNPGLLTIT